MHIEFTVEGDPRPKGRPRLGKYGNVFTPKKTIEAEQEFRKQMLPHRPDKPTHKPIAIELKFYKKKIYGGLDKSKTWADRRPDLDNYIKLVMDSMDEWFWVDDSQVVSIEATKSYDKEPRTEVRVYDLDD